MIENRGCGDAPRNEGAPIAMQGRAKVAVENMSRNSYIRYGVVVDIACRVTPYPCDLKQTVCSRKADQNAGRVGSYPCARKSHFTPRRSASRFSLQNWRGTH